MTIEQEKITAKIATIITVILFAISTTIYFTTFKATTENEIANISLENKTSESNIDKLQQDNSDLTIKLAKIESKIDSITETLWDIKIKLR